MRVRVPPAEQKEKDMQLKVFTAFSGYDSQCMALDRLGIGYDLVGWSEIDKYAIQAHNAVYPQYRDRNFGDICHIDWSKVPDFDLFTYSFPCTDISTAGKQAGLEKGSGTRSSLLWECEKAIESKKPKYLLMENVKSLTGRKYKCFLSAWEQYLSQLGYTNHTKILNAKDYGIPHNRERVFMISIRDLESYYFPEPLHLEKRLKDILECDVDEKYFLSEKMIKGFIRHNIAHVKKGTGFLWLPKTGDGTANCLRANGALNTTDNSIIVGEYSEPEIIQRSRGFNKGGTYTICPAITSNSWQENNFLCLEKIRRLTPRECFRLMGVSESDINKIQNAGISDSRQYAMAGNSIVVDVLFHIFRKLFTDKSCESIQKKLF